MNESDLKRMRRAALIRSGFDRPPSKDEIARMEASGIPYQKDFELLAEFERKFFSTPMVDGCAHMHVLLDDGSIVGFIGPLRQTNFVCDCARCTEERTP